MFPVSSTLSLNTYTQWYLNAFLTTKSHATKKGKFYLDFTESRAHGEERWPTEVTSNTTWLSSTLDSFVWGTKWNKLASSYEGCYSGFESFIWSNAFILSTARVSSAGSLCFSLPLKIKTLGTSWLSPALHPRFHANHPMRLSRLPSPGVGRYSIVLSLRLCVQLRTL